MRRLAVWVCACVAAVLAAAQPVSAQQFGFSGADPFFLYYSYYLPSQMQMSVQSSMGPSAMIQANDALRQEYALRDRAGMGAGSGFSAYLDALDSGGPDMDPTTSFSLMRQREKRLLRRMSGGVPSSNMDGRGTRHFRSGMASRYYPKMKLGYAPNKNLAITRRTGRFSGMMMGGMGGGMGGYPR